MLSYPSYKETAWSNYFHLKIRSLLNKPLLPYSKPKKCTFFLNIQMQCAFFLINTLLILPTFVLSQVFCSVNRRYTWFSYWTQPLNKKKRKKIDFHRLSFKKELFVSCLLYLSISILFYNLRNNKNIKRSAAIHKVYDFKFLFYPVYKIRCHAFYVHDRILTINHILILFQSY